MKKSIVWCEDSWDMFINGRYVGSAPTLAEAEKRLNKIVYDMITHPLASG